MFEKDKRIPFVLVAAMTRAGVIGKNGAIPWHLHEDLRQFRNLTMGGTIIMGKKTFLSLPSPLKHRCNLVVSRTLPPRSDIETVASLDEALNRASELNRPTFLVGGRSIYSEGLPHCNLMVISWVKKDYSGDVCFPETDWSKWHEVARTDHFGFVRSVYRRVDD